jgi:hypothetical protein
VSRLRHVRASSSNHSCAASATEPPRARGRRARRVVEEDQDPVAREVLERSAVIRDELADRLVVRAEDLEQLFGRGRFGERRETAQIGEQTGDVGAMSR